jgi:proteasome ATPase
MGLNPQVRSAFYKMTDPQRENYLAQLGEKINEQHNALAHVFSSPMRVGVVLCRSDRHVPEFGKQEAYYVAWEAGTLVLSARPGMNVKPGDTVEIYQDDRGLMSIVNLSPIKLVGHTVMIHDFVGDKVQVEIQSIKQLVYPGVLPNNAEIGDLVTVFNNTVIIDHMKGIGKGTVADVVSWNDIGGLADVKALVREIIEEPLLHRELYAQYKQKTPKGLLFYGEPGNGKTLMGKAIATSLKEVYAGEKSGFFYVKGPELLTKYVGQTEERIRALFGEARKFFRDYGVPAVIFLDEADALLSRRGSGISSDVMNTIVPQFLTEMGGIEDSSTIVILATNRADQLDAAVTREGRIDKRILIQAPDREGAAHILNIHLANTKHAVEQEKLVEEFIEKLYRDDLYLLYKILIDGDLPKTIGLKDILSGAMLANLAQTAIQNSIRNDIKAGKTEATGVTLDDVQAAIKALFDQHKLAPHKEFLANYVDELTRKGIKVTEVKKL